MTGTTEDPFRGESGLAFDSLDAATAERIDAYLQRAIAADETARKNFHVRHARQVLEGVKQTE